MSADLEKYLQNQREKLDVESPDDHIIWEGIRKGLQASDARIEKKRVFIRIRNIAAVAVIVLSLGYILADIVWENGSNKKARLSQFDKELGAREKEYRSMVSYRKKEIGSFNHIDNIIIAELLEEIEKLDTIYEQTLKDLSELGYNEKVINTIFDTYEKKIYLLELIILENNKIKNHETDENLFL